MAAGKLVKERSPVMDAIDRLNRHQNKDFLYLTDVKQHNADNGIILDPMAPPSPTGVYSQADEDGIVVSLNGSGTDYTAVSHETGALESSKVESHSVVASEEEANPSQMKSESLQELERISDLPEENLTRENNGVESSNTVAATDAIQEEAPDESLEKLESEAVGQTQETVQQEEVPVLTVEEQIEVPDVMDVVKQDGIPAVIDEQEKKEEVPSSQAAELLKQEVAHRSHVLGSLSKLDENSARQLLNDSGWNVSQSVRQNGKTQWYYRSPPPKPVLLGSLTSAVALWKKLADEDHKRKGGGDDDLYPMVTAFLDHVKRPATAKKRKRGRHTD